MAVSGCLDEQAMQKIIKTVATNNESRRSIILSQVSESHTFFRMPFKHFPERTDSDRAACVFAWSIQDVEKAIEQIKEARK